MNCWLRLASSAQKICNSIFCGSRGELPSTHCAFLGQFRNTSQYLTILHNTTWYYHSTSSVNSATINQTLRLSRTLEKGPPTTTTNKEPCISICTISFLPPGPSSSRGSVQMSIFDLFDAHWVFCLFCKCLFFNYSIFNLFDVTICSHTWEKVRYFSRNISEVIFLTTLVR